MKHFLRTALLTLLVAGLALAQSATIAPNENLVVDGIPDIPASVAETVARGEAQEANVRLTALLSERPLGWTTHPDGFDVAMIRCEVNLVPVCQE